MGCKTTIDNAKIVLYNFKKENSMKVDNVEYKFCPEANNQPKDNKKSVQNRQGKSFMGWRFNEGKNCWEKRRKDGKGECSYVYYADDLDAVISGKITVETFVGGILSTREHYAKRKLCLMRESYFGNSNQTEKERLYSYKSYFESRALKEEAKFENGRLISAKCYNEKGDCFYHEKREYSFSSAKDEAVTRYNKDFTEVHYLVKSKSNLRTYDNKYINSCAVSVIDGNNVEHLLEKVENTHFYFKNSNDKPMVMYLEKRFKEGKNGQEILAYEKEQPCLKGELIGNYGGYFETQKYYEEDENGNAYLAKRVEIQLFDDLQGMPQVLGCKRSKICLTYEIDRDGNEKLVKKEGRTYSSQWEDSEAYVDYVFDDSGKPVEIGRHDSPDFECRSRQFLKKRREILLMAGYDSSREDAEHIYFDLMSKKLKEELEASR